MRRSELNKGLLPCNLRHDGDKRCRVVPVSEDQGNDEPETWLEVKCCASLKSSNLLCCNSNLWQ